MSQWLAYLSVRMDCRSYGRLVAVVKRYPVTIALGSLTLVFIVPNLIAFGLVGVERAVLAFLLELEQLLVTALLSGAKWVSTTV